MSKIQAKLSIMIVIPSLHGGGAERVAVTLADYWQYRGYDVTLLTQSDPSTDVYELNKNVRRLSTQQFGQTGAWSQLKKVLAIRKMVQRYRPDVVIGIMTSASILSILACTGLGVPVVATEHAHPPSQKMSTFWQKLRQFAYPKAAKVIALTQMSAQWLKDNLPNIRVGVIPNAIQWPLKNIPPVVLPEKPLGSKLLLAVGRLHPEKGFDVLIQAFALLANQHPDWNLVILGEGGARDTLTAQVQQLSLNDRVRLPGRVGNLLDWYEQADMFVLSSHFEGMSNCLQEAMACGLCVVSFDCDTGPRELIREGIDGVLVRPVADAAALANTLGVLMSDDALRAEYAIKSPEIKDRFSMQKVGQAWDDLFIELGVKHSR